ncbi:unnamed protein product [Oppiella nova]|uniref:Ig-like domain-containing protein n=1 Tax=Oppiella nova TaxID=334625 RepID=A0A7R9L7Y7_9ACAR|nr:unnamed protein product [Oppiella nova]CAG2158572.1 unnamed protein product [Oppiella nova]
MPALSSYNSSADSSRHSIGSAYDTSSSRVGTGTSRWDRGSSRLDTLSTRLDTTPARRESDFDTSSAFRTSSGTSRLERTSRYSLQDSSDLDAPASRWGRTTTTTSRFITDTDSDTGPFSRRESRTSRLISDSSLDLDTSSSRYDRTSRILRESIDSEVTPSSRYETRKSSRILTESPEVDTTSRWDRTSTRFGTESPEFESSTTRYDKKSSRLVSVSSDIDEPSTRYDRSSRYTTDYSTELDAGSPKWDTEYSSQYNRWDSAVSRLDRQSSRVSTDSTDLDTGVPGYDSRSTRLDRQTSRTSEAGSESSRSERRSKYESSYGLTQQSDADNESSGLVRTTSGIIRGKALRETTDSEVDSTPSKPKVKKTIKSVSQSEGQTATLECEISGYPTPSVQWLKENKIISNEDRFETRSNGNKHYLIINDLKPEDVGLYTVAATNTLGTSSSSAAINVLPGVSSPTFDSRPTSPGGSFLPRAPKFKVKLKDTELLDGTTVRFELVVRGMPIPTVSFYKDNEPLKEDKRIKILFESKEVFELMIDHITEEDAGLYKCVAINSEGKDETSGRITVTINDCFPNKTEHKDVFPGIEDEPSVDFTKADSLSPRSRSPVFKWFKDGKEFEASERFQVQFDDEEDTITLVFQHVKPEDAGLYTCAASTSSGKISCSAELTVQGLLNQLPRDPIPPTIKLAMADVEVSEGASAMLEAKVAAYPRPQIRWYRGRELIESSERYKFLYEDEESYTLVIKNTKKEDEGMYRVVAINDLGEVDTSAKLTVNVSPRFRRQMRDQSVMTDECLKLEVEIDANPTPDVKWFKDGQQIKEKKGIKILSDTERSVYNLMIEKVKIEDSGNYSCVATNELGQQTSYNIVTVNGPPVFKSKLENVEIVEGQRAELAVTVGGYPKPNVKFTKNEKQVKEDSRVKVTEDKEGSFKLVINESSSLDSGKYKCIASNEWGEETSEAELTIKKSSMKPNFIKKLRDSEAKDGDQQIEFNVQVEGIPKPEIKWFREGLEIKERDGFKYVIDDENQSYTLIIPKVSGESAGSYKCEAHNSEGSAQTSGVLTVNTSPKFIKKLEDISVNEEEEVRLVVKVVGCPTPSVKWFKDETRIETNDRRLRYEEASNEYTLHLSNTSAEDKAVYKVIAENVFGKCDTTGKLNVSLNATKPIFTTKLSDREALENETNIEFSVTTDSQTTKPTIKWFIDETEITESDKRYKLVVDQQKDAYKLVIKSATEESVGQYKCLATNSSGSAETSAKFTVVTKPKFIKGLEDVEANEGETVAMTVKVKGSPEPEVKFLKDGRDVSAEATVVIKKEIDDIYILEIENIRIIMSGEYQCHIKNTAGEAFSKGTVIVNSKPKFVKDLEDKESAASENVVLEVVVTGSPTPEITWFKDGKRVDGTERVILESREEVFKLKLDNASVDDSGVYKCRARNKSGEVDSNVAKVNVNEGDRAPVFVKHIADSKVVVGEDVRFETKVEAKPEPQVVWSKNGVQLKPSNKIEMRETAENTYELVLKDLEVEDSGDILCRAENSKGQATDRARLTVQEPESPTIVSLSDVSVVEESAAKLEANITGTPKPVVNWYKDGEPIADDLVFSEPENDLYWIQHNSVTEELCGKYVCNASNSVGDAQQSVQLSISGRRPKFTRELDDIITMSVGKEKGKLVLGQNAVFEAEVVGIPTPKVQWIKDGVQMVPSDRITINNVEHNYTLEIKTLARNDVAQYVCKAVNPHGEAKSVCLLKFQDTPHPPIVKKELPKTVTVEEGTRMCLVAQVDGEPIPSTQWTKNGEPIKPSDDCKIVDRPDGTTSLIVESVSPQHSGEYAVKAINLKGEVITSTAVSVEPPKRKPSFDKELPKQMILEEKQSLNLTVKVDGQPTPDIKWTKDGSPVKTSSNVVIDQNSDGTQSLRILSAKAEDSGVYMIRATNTGGQTTCSTAVKVSPPQTAPIIDKKLPKRVSIESGEPLELVAKISGEPIPDVKWSKDGVDIKESDNFKVEVKADGTVTLRKESSEPEDKGKYELIANNAKGSVSAVTEVDVKPVQFKDIFINKIPQSLNVFEGQPLLMAAKVEGKPEIEWTKDGKPIKPSSDIKIVTKDDGTIALSIESAKPQHSGHYAVIAKTPKGDVISASDVNVLSGVFKAPKIETQFPKTVDVLEGKPLILTAKVEGQPLGDVKWLKDDVPVKQSDGFKVEINPDGTVSLSVDKARTQDSGRYTLIVENDLGEVRAGTDVDVQKGPIIADKLPETIEVLIGNPFILIAKVDGNPLPKVEWTKDGVPVKATDGVNLEIKPDGTVALSVDKARVEDSGDYVLIAKSLSGDIKSATKVDVQKGPIIVDKLPEYVDVIVGKALSLAAKIIADTKPDISWTKDGVPIQASDSTRFETNPDGSVELNISNAKPIDTGKYAIVAKTASGEAVSCKFRKVMFCGLSGDTSLDTPRDTFSSFVSIFLLTTLLRRLDSSDSTRFETNPDGSVELNISNAKPIDTGKYAIVAKTASGEAVSCSDVDVQSGPIFREQLPESVNVIEGRPVNLFARVDGNPWPQVEWSKDGVLIAANDSTIIKCKPDGAVSLLIESSTPDDTGKYAVIAKSPTGEAVSISDIEVRKGPIIKEKLPQYVNVLEGQPLILTARSEGISIKNVKWAKDGVPIKASDSVRVESKPDGHLALSIDNAQTSDAGKYELIIKTPTEELKTSSDVNVVKSDDKSPQLVTKFPKAIDVIEGKPLTLTVKVDGEPMPEIKWLKDDVPIQTNDCITIDTKPDGTVTLSVDNTRPQDSGKYSVVATNPSGEIRALTDVVVQKGPVIAQKLLESVVVVAGNPLVLLAKVEGLKAPTFQWTKDGVPVKAKDGINIETKPDGIVELSVDKARLQDMGEYRLTVKGTTGDLVTSSKVDVQKGPIIVDKLPEYVDVMIGKPLTLSAKVDGQPIPIVKWLKDGNRIQPSDSMRIETKPDGSVALSIDCIQSGDLGKYTIIAKNCVGEAVSECAVDVQTGPIIRDKLPETLNIIEGHPFELIAKVDGNPMPEVKWTKDGVPVEPMEGIEIRSKPDGTVSLNIDCAQNDDSGRYAVIARSPSGEVLSKSTVDVQKGPIIKEKLPEYVNINEGQPLRLLARVEGQPINDVKWTKNGVPIEAAKGTSFETKPNGDIILDIENTQPSDAGKYVLIISTPNQDLKTMSDVNVIRNNSKEPEILNKFPEVLDVIEGKPLLLSAKIAAEPKPTIQWLKEDIPVVAGKGVKIESKPDGTVTLHIVNAQPQDSGKYTLKVENPFGEAKASSEVDVQKGGPIIACNLPESVDIVVGKPLTLAAKIDGEPKPQVKWTKDGVPLTETEGMTITSKPDGTVELSIDRTKPENTGQYAVVASSPAGEVSSISNVDVLKGPLVLVKLPESLDIIAGKALNLRAKVDAQQSPLIKWTKDGIRVEPDEHIRIDSKPDGTVSLDIDCAQLNDTGKYAVIAKTRDGEDESSSNVFVQKGPVVIEPLPESVSIVEGKPLNLTAKFDGKPMPEVQWFRDNVPIKPTKGLEIKSKPDGTTSLSIGSAQEKDSGEYAVIAKSPSGEVMCLSNIEVKKGPVFKQKLPRAVEVVAGKPLKLVAKIDGLPQQQPVPPIVNWVKDGYPVRFTEKIKFETKPTGLVSLSIASTLPKDTGKYAVIAKTPEGEIVSTSVVAVKNLPVFIDSLPKTLDVVEGKPLKLCAKIENDSIPQIVWTKDGVPIKPSDSGVLIKTKPDGTVSLEILKAQLGDSGQYSVAVKAPEGEIKSSCDVSVQKGLIIIDNLPHSVSVCEGRPLHLSTRIDGKPLPEVTWIKDGVTIKPDSDGFEIRSKPDGTYMLTLGSAKPTDSGEYVMIARNLNEEVVAVTNVDVEKGPVLREKLPEKVNVVEGEPLVLSAKIESETPPEKIIWTKDGVPVKASDAIKLKTRPDGSVCLSIDCAKLSDAGKYAVFAKIGNRGVGSMSVVSVSKAPEEKTPQEEEVPEEDQQLEFRDKLPKSLSVVEGNPLKLVAKIARRGERIPEVKWTKNGVPVEESDRVRREWTPNGTVSLKIDSALLSDAGSYSLSFKTSDGMKSCAVAVQVSPKSTVDRPVFIKGLSRISAEEGKSCRLEGKVSGDIDSINWFRNGEKLSANEHFGFVKESDGTIALLIDSVKSDDSGEYSVDVSNKSGKDESSAVLKVLPKAKEKPIFLEELKPIITNEGNKLVLKAVYKSDLPVTVKWMKDGFDLQSNNRIQISEGTDGTVTLTIGSAQLDDSGKYTISVINDEGRVRSSGAVTVGSKGDNKPLITEGLIPVTLMAGELAKLTVKATGEPIPDIRFIKDGQQVIPNDRVHIKGQAYGKTELVFDEVRPEDEGNYTAVAVNDSGEARSSAPVLVNRSPKFEKPLTDTTGIEGYPAKLETKVDGRPQPDIKWTKDGQTLRPDGTHLKLYAGDDGIHTLLFDKCSPNDSGTYGVIASNEFGKTETSAPFSVKSKTEDMGPDCAPLFIGSLRDVVVNEGQTIDFFAQIKANPIPDIKWYFEGQEIRTSAKIQISFDGSMAQLKITKCETKHKGLYELKISNSLGDSTSKAKADVMGKSGPKFVQKFSDSEVGLSEPLKLVCRVIGFPEPDIEWYCNGNRIEAGIHYSIIREGDVSSLVIVRPTDKMTGAYECRATNICGTDSCKANITFMDTEARGESASFFKKLSDCEVREGKTAKFTACVTGSPKPEIKWFKNGVEFDPLSSTSKYNVEYLRNGLIRFEIYSVEASDLGEYRCHAMNTHGYDNSIAHLKFECKPCLMPSLLLEANQRAIAQLIPELQPFHYALSALCLFVSLIMFMKACGPPELPCDTSLDSISEFIFKCISESCNPTSPATPPK